MVFEFNMGEGDWTGSEGDWTGSEVADEEGVGRVPVLGCGS